MTQLQDLKRHLEISLAQQPESSIAQAIELTILPIPCLSINVGKLTELVRTRWACGQLTVLTELSNNAISATRGEAFYRDLLRNCISAQE